MAQPAYPWSGSASNINQTSAVRIPWTMKSIIHTRRHKGPASSHVAALRSRWPHGLGIAEPFSPGGSAASRRLPLTGRANARPPSVRRRARASAFPASATPPAEVGTTVSPDDAIFAAKVDAVAADVLAAAGKPQQVTKSRLFGALPRRLADIASHRARNPATLARVTENRESTWHFRASRYCA